MSAAAMTSSGPTSAKMNEFVEAMKKKGGDSEEELEKAFQVLSNGTGSAHVPTDVLRRAIEDRGLNLTVEEVDETILYISKKEKVEEQLQINCDQFIQIVKSLEKPTVAEQVRKACQIIGKGEGRKIVLYGKQGVGKTWMAGKVAGRALRQRKFDVAIWVYLSRTYEGTSLQESIAYQLSVLDDFEDSEAQLEAKKNKDKDGAKEEKPVEMKNSEREQENVERKRDKIEQMIRAKLEGKKLLLILDNEGSKMRLEWSQVDGVGGKKRLMLKLDDIDLGKMLGLNQLKYYEFLITSKSQPTASGDIGIMVRPLTMEESKSLVSQEIHGDDDKSKEMKGLADFFIDKSERLPSEILIISRVVSYFGKRESGLEKLRKDREVLEEDGGGSTVADVLIRGYERLPKSVLIDCYSSDTSERHFLHRGGMVNFNELISYWILEGHLGHFDRIEDAYEEGHRVLMELIYCGLLEKQEGNYVAPSGPRFDFDIHDRNEVFRKVHSGLGVTFDMNLGRVVLDDGMIRTIDGKKASTFLLDGNHIGEKGYPSSLFGSENELEKKNLVIFNPTCQHFQLPIFKMKNLHLLVLRGCRFLDSIEHNFQWTNDQENPKKISRSLSLPSPLTSSDSPSFAPPIKLEKKMEKLTVLEISGPSSLNEIPDNLFKSMPNLRTLNMSHLQIKSLPSSFNQLTKIEFLILRGCSSLQEIDSLKNFKDLQVLDLSSSTSFEKFHDKSLHINTELQILNLSRTKIKTIPLINSNKALQFVSLSDCTALQRIRKIDKLERLQIFDISGSVEVEEFCDPSLESLKSLVILDVSRTAIRRLPSNISNPKFLFVRSCPRLKRLPPIEDFTGVESIDLSGCSLLEEIRKEFFGNMKCLRELNLSKTKIKHLPCLPTLCRLLLSNCEHFEELENLSSLEEMEVLDLSGCKALKEMEGDTFGKMNRLSYLNLSGTRLAQLPSLSKLINLKKVYVKDCPNPIALSGIEELPMLEILDHSGTILKPPPSFTNPDRPRVIGATIDNIDHQHLLEILGASSAGVSSGKSESTDHLEDLRECKWRISNWRSEETTDENTLGSSMYGIHFLHLSNKYPSLMVNKLRQFHFLVYPIEAEAKLPDKSTYRTELSLRDIYFEQVCKEKLEKRLEIRAFDSCPPFIRRVLEQAQFVLLVDDPFCKSLIDLVGDSNITAMKACWIEMCNELEHVLIPDKNVEGNKPEEKKKEDTKKQEENKIDEDGNKQEKKKKEEANKQEAEKKEEDASKQEEKKKEEGNKQEEKKKEEDDANKQEEMKKGEDGNKQEEKKKEEDANKQEEKKKEEDANKQEEKKKEEGGNKQEEKKEEGTNEQEGKKKEEADANKQEEKKKEEAGANKQEQKKKEEEDGNKQEEKKNPADVFKNLEILWISDGMNLRSILDGDIQTISFKSIKYLYLEYCPKITMLCSSSMQLESLEILYVKYCPKMDKLFTDDSPQLNKLTKLHLWGLQELKTIGCKAPFLRSLRVGECPFLEHVIDASSEADKHSEVEGHENLELIHIKFCDKVKTICKEDGPYFPKLRELELWALPDVQEVAFNAPSLQCLRVGECRCLRKIEGSSYILKILEVKHCEVLKTVFGERGLDLGEVEEMELLSLPEVENVGGANFLPSSRINRLIWGCPKLCGNWKMMGKSMKVSRISRFGS